MNATLRPAEWEEKVWGRTRPLVETPFYSEHELEVAAGGFCSLHYHQQRANLFSVETGVLEILEFFGPVLRRTTLGPGDSYTVSSCIPHLFLVQQAGRLREIYFPDRGGQVQRDDIVRLSEGGRLAAPCACFPFCRLAHLAAAWRASLPREEPT